MHFNLYNKNKNIDKVTGIFLLIVAVCGNFVAETLSCQTQKLLSENMFAKNFIIIMIIYFAIGFTSDIIINPLMLLYQTIIIWVFFIFFNKMTLPFTITSFIGLFGIIFINNYIKYYENEDKNKNKDIILSLEKINEYLLIFICITILIGHGMYFSKQYNDYYKDFSYITFLFGKNKCKSIT